MLSGRTLGDILESLTTVVPALPPDDAEREWLKWRVENPDIVKRLSPEDVVKDVMRGVDGKMKIRYRIRYVQSST